jgi:hypothetical protein
MLSRTALQSAAISTPLRAAVVKATKLFEALASRSVVEADRGESLVWLNRKGDFSHPASSKSQVPLYEFIVIFSLVRIDHFYAWLMSVSFSIRCQ